jgi:uncharacterized protein
VIAVNVAQLLKSPVGASRDFDFSDWPEELDGEFELLAPITGRAHLLRTVRGILANSSYRARVRQSCGRCLGPSDQGIEGTSSDEFVPSVDVVSGHPLEREPGSDELEIDARHVLDLTEVIRQDLLTRLPLQPLCDDSCPGLCPHCGQELRSGTCDCQGSVDSTSPFAALAELLHRDGSNEATRG